MQSDRIFEVTQIWESAFPGAHAGLLVMRDVQNPAQHRELEKLKGEVEVELRSRFSGLDRAAMLQDPILQVYNLYYRGFKKTYHIQLQLESILFKGKSIPSVAALVEAMFMAEMKSFLLTAGHDLDAIRFPMRLDVAQGTESYKLLRGDLQVPKAGDMMITDAEGIVSSILYGPDQRTQITAQTRNVVFTVYAPNGIEVPTIEQHLLGLRDNVLIIAPDARVELLDIFDSFRTPLI